MNVNKHLNSSPAQNGIDDNLAGPQEAASNLFDGRSEAEKKLDYKLLPSRGTQKKMEYLISPYNQSKLINKYMTFNSNSEEDEAEQQEKWNTISKLVFIKNKKEFRDTMLFINKKLYVELSKNFNCRIEEHLEVEDLETIQKRAQFITERKMSKRENNLAKRDQFRKNRQARASVMTQMITSMRDKKERSPSMFHQYSFGENTELSKELNRIMKKRNSRDSRLSARFSSKLS